jgi:hypothetical protein
MPEGWFKDSPQELISHGILQDVTEFWARDAEAGAANGSRIPSGTEEPPLVSAPPATPLASADVSTAPETPNPSPEVPV